VSLAVRLDDIPDGDEELEAELSEAEVTDLDWIDSLADTAVKHTDHVHATLDQAAKHSNDQATIRALQRAQEAVEEAQEDLREIQGEAQDGDPP